MRVAVVHRRYINPATGKRVDARYLDEHAIPGKGPGGSAIACHDEMNRAIRAGALVRPAECSRCATSGVRIFGHHDSYKKPLDVAWLCASCHSWRHVEIRLAAAERLGLVVRAKSVTRPRKAAE